MNRDRMSRRVIVTRFGFWIVADSSYVCSWFVHSLSNKMLSSRNAVVVADRLVPVYCNVEETYVT